MADICNQAHLILPSVDISVKLWPTCDEFRLIANPDELECKIMIEEIFLNVYKVSVSPEVMMGHNAGLEISEGK